MIFGGILAGGTGTRMGAKGGLPKQFLEVGEVPVIVRTLRRFLEVDEINSVVVAMHPDWKDYASGLLVRHGIDMARVRIVDGGATRFESLIALARTCVTIADACGVAEEPVMISHDCARPFVSAEILKANIAALADYDVVTTSIPTIDTVLLSRNGKESDSVPDRSTVFLDQGPQAVKLRHFLGLAESLSSEERARYIEAGRLYLDRGFRVGIVTGDRNNFKLTTPFDLELAEALLKKGIVR